MLDDVGPASSITAHIVVKIISASLKQRMRGVQLSSHFEVVALLEVHLPTPYHASLSTQQKHGKERLPANKQDAVARRIKVTSQLADGVKFR